MLMITTPLNWTPAQPEWMPDADVTVMVWLLDETGHGDWFSGWWDGIGWCDCVSGGYFAGTVTHWADPIGPLLQKQIPMDCPTLRSA